MNIDADISQPREKAQLAIAIPIALKKRLRELARGEGVKLGDYVVAALQQHAREKDQGRRPL